MEAHRQVVVPTAAAPLARLGEDAPVCCFGQWLCRGL